MLEQLLKKTVGTVIFQPYYAIRTSWPVWFWLLNREGRLLLRKCGSDLDEIKRRVVGDLKRDGIAITSIESLFPQENLFSRLKHYAENLLSQAKIREGKPFLKMCWEDDAPISLDNPFVRFSIEERVLNIVNKYLGVFSKLYYFALDETLTVPPGSPVIRSQGWHRDPEDKRMCKMFIYLTDVEEDSGPFQYVLQSHYGGKRSGIYPQKPPKGSYPPPGKVEELVSPGDIKICTGKAGTVIFADTAGLHRGGYATSKNRVMFTAEYSSKAALRPIHYRYPENFLRDVRWKISATARYAVDNDFGITLGILNAISDFSRKYNLH